MNFDYSDDISLLQPSSLPREAYKIELPADIIEPIQVTELPKRIYESENKEKFRDDIQLKRYYIEELIHFSE